MGWLNVFHWKCCLFKITNTLQLDWLATCFTAPVINRALWVQILWYVCESVQGAPWSHGPIRPRAESPEGPAELCGAALWGSTLSFSSSSSSLTNQRTALQPLSTHCAQWGRSTHTNALLHRHLLAENSMGPKTHSHAFQKPSVGHWIYNHSRTQAYSSTSLSRVSNREPSFFLTHTHSHVHTILCREKPSFTVRYLNTHFLSHNLLAFFL